MVKQATTQRKLAELEALLPGAVGNLKAAGVDKETLGLIAELAQFACEAGWSFGTDRLGHGECSLLEILINADGVIDIVEDFQCTVAQQYPHVALLAQVFHVVGHHDKARGLALLIEGINAFLFETSIPHRSDLIGQIDIKVKSHTDGKGELGFHAAGVGFYWQLEVLSYFGKLLDPLLHLLGIAYTVDTTDEAGVLPPCHAPLKSATEGQRPGDATMARYLALIGCIHTAQQAKQGGFARPVDPQNADIAIPRQRERYIAQHIVTTKFGRVVLGNRVKNNHRVSL